MIRTPTRNEVAFALDEPAMMLNDDNEYAVPVGLW
jgi:hypothetical protein